MWPRRLSALLLGAGASLLAGCALFGSKPVPPPAPVVQAPSPPPPAPVLAAPTDTHKFVLTNATDDVVGVLQTVELSKDDTLPDIARRFNVGYEEMVRANPGVDPWLPGAGKHVVVPTQFVLPNAPRTGIVINVAALRLFYFPAHKAGEPQVVYTYPIGIGKVGWSTPEGVTTVVGHQKDPIWRPSEALREDHFNDSGEKLPAVVAAGPDNPLGKYEFILGWPSYRIHGTNKPYGVGLRSSHGCVRLYPEDIEQLFKMAPNGTQVRVVNQPFVLGWHNQQVYLQAYTVLEDDHRNWTHAQKTLLTKAMPGRAQDVKTAAATIDWQQVADLMKTPRGVPVPLTGADQPGDLDAVLAAAPLVENRIPDGADWDGTDDTGTDGKSAQQLLSEQEPTSATTTAPPSHTASTTTHVPKG